MHHEGKLMELLERTIDLVENHSHNENQNDLRIIKYEMNAIKLDRLIFNDKALIGQTLRHVYLPYTYEVVNLHKRHGYIAKVVEIHHDQEEKPSPNVKLGDVQNVTDIHPRYSEWYEYYQIKESDYA